MRISSGVDLLDLYLSQQDGIYPSKSPTPDLKATTCLEQPCKELDECDTLEYNYKGLCRAPSSWQADCPNAKPDDRAAYAAQTSKATKEPRVQEDTRQSRRKAKLVRWVRTKLIHYMSRTELNHIARVYYYDRDMTVTQDEYDLLADTLFQDYCQLPKGAR